MNKEELNQKLVEIHKAFIETVNALDEAKFTHSKEEKWTAGQQLDHIFLSVKPLTVAMALPGFMTKMMFGKANRPSRTYDEVIAKYQEKLEEGGVAPSRFVPKEIPFSAKEDVMKKLKKTLNVLSNQLDRMKENQLDEIVIPHPLLGKMTVREMIYFTIYHGQHHHKATMGNLDVD